MRLIGTEILPGMGLGNMLLAYVSIRGLAHRLHADFAILGRELLMNALSERSGDPFLTLDYGLPAKKEDFARILHEHENRLFIGNSLHDLTHGCYVSGEDESLYSLDPEGGVLLYGNLQAEGYFGGDTELLSSWLTVAEGFMPPQSLSNTSSNAAKRQPEENSRRRILRQDQCNLCRLRHNCEYEKSNINSIFHTSSHAAKRQPEEKSRMQFLRLDQCNLGRSRHKCGYRKSNIDSIFHTSPLCVINLRGGEYTGSPELFLRPGYFRDAMGKMRELHPDMRFFVVTDDPAAAARILPEIPAAHFSVSEDYLSIKNARYLILSNSSFALLPAFTNPDLSLAIAPKYWARHNVSTGYWSGEQNIYSPLRYLDREGRLFTPEECKEELIRVKRLSPLYQRLNRPLTGAALSMAKARALSIRLRDMAARIPRSLGRRIGFYRHKALALFLLLILLICGLTAAGFLAAGRPPANPAPRLIPTPKSWNGGFGETVLAGGIVSSSEAGEAAALMLSEELSSRAGAPFTLKQRPEAGDILLSVKETLPEEAYSLQIGALIRLEASSPQGFIWGARSILSMTKAKGESSSHEQPADKASSPEALLLPRGRLEDCPEYPVRGISFDVARKPVSLDGIRRLLKAMSSFKLNELTLHLNDNELLVYSGKTDSLEQAYSLYGAYRLSSSLPTESGKSYTAEDLCYSGEEFSELVKEARALGITLIPELDAPAHCLAFTAKSPSLGLPSPEAADQLNLGKLEAWELVDALWAEQEEENLAECPIVHIGGDEYYGSPDEYLGFMEYIAQKREQAGKRVRFWGSLSRIRGSGALPPPGSRGIEGRQRELVVWNTDWADPREMAENGFALINANHSELYLIPGGGQDRLEKESFYREFRPERFPLDGPDGTLTGETAILEKEAVLGAELALWNDFSGTLENGMNEEDMLERLLEACPYLAEKTWHGPEPAMSFTEFAALTEESHAFQ